MLVIVEIMKPIKHLETLSKEEGKHFVNSFDFVLSDIDGVLLLTNSVLPGAEQCIEKLRDLGKKIAFVTNNTISSFETIKEELEPFKADDHEIINPVRVIIDYLKKINCPRDIYCITGHVLKKSLANAGYNIINMALEDLPESMPLIKDICLKFLDDCQEIGAVVVDLDINFKLMQAQGAILLLTKNPDMPFLCAATDDSGPLTEDIEFIGNKFYVNAIERITKKECTILAKPSLKLKEYLEEKFGIEDPSRVLFIGDSLTSDITFANRAGYQSLLVLTGQTKLDDLVNWQFEEINRPDYYTQSLDHLCELICKNWNVE